MAQKASEIVTIPPPHNGHMSDSELTTIANKFREIRLKSLQIAPEAFASTYEGESRRGLEHTLERLRNPKATHFIALKESNQRHPSSERGSDIERLLDQEWLGLIVLLGPVEDTSESVSTEKDPFLNMAGSGKEESMIADSEMRDSLTALHFHLNAVFVDPAARGMGLGGSLIDAAVQRARRETNKYHASLRVTISVYDKNKAARKIYEKAGFEVVDERQSKSHGDRKAINMELSTPAQL